MQLTVPFIKKVICTEENEPNTCIININTCITTGINDVLMFYNFCIVYIFVLYCIVYMHSTQRGINVHFINK